MTITLLIVGGLSIAGLAFALGWSLRGLVAAHEGALNAELMQMLQQTMAGEPRDGRPARVLIDRGGPRS